MNNKIDNLVRDVTQVGSILKSEVRRRILELVAEAERLERERWIEEIKKMRSDHVKQGVNLNHENDELWCCLECHGDDMRNCAFEKIIEKMKI